MNGFSFPPGNPPRKLLWLDAEIEFLRAHIRFLESNGFRVDGVSSLSDVLHLMQLPDCDYDVVVLDEQTLGKEGASTVERVRRHCPHRVPLLLVSKGDETRAASSERGKDADGFIGKPVNPRQMLTSCRSALLARAERSDPVTAAYVRSRGEIRSTLLATPSPSRWEKIHFQISRWDDQVDASRDEALQETHAEHKRTLSREFLAWTENHYTEWVGRRGGNPDLHLYSLRRKLQPVLQAGGPAALVVLSGLRFDQWHLMQKDVGAWFRVENAAAWALLPTERDFCRTALFSGLLPRDVALDQPTLWARLREGGDEAACLRELLRVHLRRLGSDIDDPRIFSIDTRAACKELPKTLAENADARLVVVVIELLDLLRPEHPDACVPMAPGMSEAAVRAAAVETFRSCGIGDSLKALADQGRTVVLTADHGSVRADTPAEVFCQEEQSAHPRVKIGPNISCDERQALFVEAPERFGLPGEEGDTAYAIAKDRFYFVYPNKYQYFVTPYKDRMVTGGLSMDEVIVPLATLTPLPAAQPPAG